MDSPIKANRLTFLGLMSGSSLDGVDLAIVQFFINDQGEVSHWSLIDGKTIPYNSGILEKLRIARSLSGEELWQLHADLGREFAQIVNSFIGTRGRSIDYIASHGHTIFHSPKTGMTCQIGDGATLSAHSGIPVICDFRSTDVANGGQGAPIAPLVDRLLYPQYRCFLNLGGIANIHIQSKKHAMAYDVCACNQLLNYFAEKLGQPYDDGGAIAATGQIQPDLLNYFNDWWYYKNHDKKSLGNAEVWDFIKEADEKFNFETKDFLRTATEHISDKIAMAFLDTSESAGIFSTGGGVMNTFLIKLISNKLGADFQIVIPDNKIVDFKEAILMAVAGLQRVLQKPVFTHGLTGTNKDSFGGAIYWNIQSELHDR